MKNTQGLIALTTRLKGANAQPRLRHLERFAVLEELGSVLGDGTSARVGTMTMGRNGNLTLPVYHSGGDFSIEADSEDIRCFYQLVSIVASRDASVVMSDDWDTAARKACIPSPNLGPAAKRHLDAMQSNRLHLVGAALALVETGEMHEELETKWFSSIAQLCDALRKRITGEGRPDGRLIPATG
jgi:hypothetical protein